MYYACGATRVYGIISHHIGHNVNFFFQAEDGIRDYKVTGVQTCALPIWLRSGLRMRGCRWRWPEECCRRGWPADMAGKARKKGGKKSAPCWSGRPGWGRGAGPLWPGGFAAGWESTRLDNIHPVLSYDVLLFNIKK